MFLRQTTVGREPLPIAMSGVRAGERALQIGVDDPRLAGALAAKVGLSGHAAIAVADEKAAERVRKAAAAAGGLLDVHVTSLGALPFEDGAFDVVVVNSMRGLLSSLGAGPRADALRECHRVLRHGGRLLVIETGPRSGLRALLGPAREESDDYRTAGGSLGALEVGGFMSVRLIAERDGYRFVEGLKGN